MTSIIYILIFTILIAAYFLGKIVVFNTKYEEFIMITPMIVVIPKNNSIGIGWLSTSITISFEF